MEPAAGGVVDFFGDGGGEGDDIMIERFLQFFLAGNQAGQIGGPFFRASFILAKSARGTTPCLTSASLASSSICSQRRSLFSSVQMARISGRE